MDRTYFIRLKKSLRRLQAELVKSGFNPAWGTFLDITDKPTTIFIPNKGEVLSVHLVEMWRSTLTLAVKDYFKYKSTIPPSIAKELKDQTKAWSKGNLTSRARAGHK